MATPPVPTPDVSNRSRNEFSIELQPQVEWVVLDPSTLPPGNRSAVAIRHARDPATGIVYGDLSDLDADPHHLVRGFHLASDRLLVGEPIVIEHRIELNGEGTWNEPIGGNYRARGRDDNFWFLLVAKDGTALPDPYGPATFGLGGISSRYAVTQEAAQSYFHAVQRYAIADRPGRYDLYCFGFASDHEMLGRQKALDAAVQREHGGRYRLGEDGYTLVRTDGTPTTARVVPSITLGTNTPGSPLARDLPAVVIEALGEGRAAGIMDFAHFEIELRPGTPGERAAMVERWVAAAAADQRQSMQAGPGEAARQALWFSRSEDVLPTLGAWMKTASTRPQDLDGLALWGNPKAVDLLLDNAGHRAMSRITRVPPAVVSRVFPRVIPYLEHDDDSVRAQAFDALSRWSGQRFGAAWDGYRQGRPDKSEAPLVRTQIEAWWAANGGDDFVPAG